MLSVKNVQIAHKIASVAREARNDRCIHIVLVAVIAATAISLSLSQMQAYQTADSIVPVLTSLQHWTPFFWETNRYGMLVPLMTRPLRDPLANLVAQSAITTFACLLSSFLVIRYFFGSAKYWFVAAALQNIWLLLLMPKAAQFDWFVVQNYGISVSLGLLSLIMLTENRAYAAGILMLLAVWVNSGIFILLFPLIVFKHAATHTRRFLVSSIVLTAAGAGAGIVMMARSRFANTTVTLLPISLWGSSWRQLAESAQSNLSLTPDRMGWVVAPAVLGLAIVACARPGRNLLLIPLALVGTAFVYYLAMGMLTWVNYNAYAPRYIYPSLLLSTLAFAILVVAPLETYLGQSHLALIFASISILACALLVFGPPSVRIVRAQIDQHFGTMTNDLLESRAKIVIGNYWRVWPAVFHANLVLYERGQHRGIYGGAYRGSVTSRSWIYDNALCAAAPKQDNDAVIYLQNLGRHFQLERSMPTIDEFCEH